MWHVSFFFQAEDGIRDGRVTGVQTCALPIFLIEHYAGNFPLWLAPDQVRVITLNDDEALINYAKPIVNELRANIDRKSTRLNSSHPSISYAVFCLKKKNKKKTTTITKQNTII